MQMYAKRPERERKHWHRYLHLFLLNKTLSNLFIVQKNIKGGNASNCMVALLFSDTISKRNNRQFYLLTCRKCYLLLVDLPDM